MSKNCLFCKHFYFRTGEYGYSAFTPGWEAELGCEKEVWELDMYKDTEEVFRSKMLTANDCALYEGRE